MTIPTDPKWHKTLGIWTFQVTEECLVCGRSLSSGSCIHPVGPTIDAVAEETFLLEHKP